MFEEQTNLESGAETNEPGNQEVSNEVTQNDESVLSPDSGNTLEQPAEENEEIEVDGKKFALPKSAAEKLKAERMMHGDYTRKTQEVAEQRRALDAQAAEVQQQRQQHQQYIADVAKVVAIDEQLAAYQNLDWQRLIDQDPVEALKHQNNLRMLEGKRNEVLQVLAQKEQQAALNEQQEIAKQVQEAEAYFAREISGWSPARSEELMKYGVEAGIPADVIRLAARTHPVFAKILNKANLYDQIAKKQTPAAPPPPQAKPASKVGGNASVKKDPTQMTDAEFSEYRRRTSQNRRK